MVRRGRHSRRGAETGGEGAGGERAGDEKADGAGGEGTGGAAGGRAAGGEGASGSGWAAWVDAAAARAGGLHPKVLAAARSTREPPQVRGGGYVVDALEAALWALRTTATFEDGVLAAVNLGDDADTTAAIYGQLAGAIYGLDGIPERWRARVHRGDEIVAMADALYDLDHSRPAIARFAHVRPSRVVACETPEQVAKALRTASRVAIRSGGHCFAGRSTTTGTLIDVSPMNEVRLDGELATIGAGARLGAIYDALAAHGRTIVAGCGPTVGIAGLTLGGGIGILGRRYGLTCDQLVAATGRARRRADRRHRRPPRPVVGAARRRRRALRRRHGARVQDRRRPERTTVFDMLVPRTPEVVAQWQRWAPARARGARREPARARRRRPRLRRLRRHRGRRPSEQLAGFGGDGRIEELEFRAAKQWLADNGPDDGRERPFLRSGFFTRPIDPPLDCKLDFMPLGGAFSAPAPDATAYPHRDALFCLHVEAADQATADRVMDALQPVGVYPNFPEPDRDVWDPAYHLGNRERLLAIRDTYDPDGLFSPPPGAA